MRLPFYNRDDWDASVDKVYPNHSLQKDGTYTWIVVNGVDVAVWSTIADMGWVEDNQ